MLWWYRQACIILLSCYTLCSGDTNKHVSDCVNITILLHTVLWWYRQACIILLSCYTLCSGDTDKHVSYYYLATHCALVIQTSMYHITILLHTVLWWYRQACIILLYFDTYKLTHCNIYEYCSGDTNKHVSYYYLATHCALVIQTSMYHITILLHTVLWWYRQACIILLSCLVHTVLWWYRQACNILLLFLPLHTVLWWYRQACNILLSCYTLCSGWYRQACNISLSWYTLYIWQAWITILLHTVLWWYRQACNILLTWYTLCSGDTDKHVHIFTIIHLARHTVHSGDYITILVACNRCTILLWYTLCSGDYTIILGSMSGDTDKHVSYYYFRQVVTYTMLTLCGDTDKHVTYY